MSKADAKDTKESASDADAFVRESITDTTKNGQTSPSTSPAPAVPPKHLRPAEQAKATLVEAFPTIDTAIIDAVLTASGGSLEPAFNALLGMSDPTFKPEFSAHPVCTPCISNAKLVFTDWICIGGVYRG